MNSNVRFKTIDNRGMKGIIVTAETLMDLRRNLRDAKTDYSLDQKVLKGMESMVDFLEKAYYNI